MKDEHRQVKRIALAALGIGLVITLIWVLPITTCWEASTGLEDCSGAPIDRLVLDWGMWDWRKAILGFVGFTTAAFFALVGFVLSVRALRRG